MQRQKIGLQSVVKLPVREREAAGIQEEDMGDVSLFLSLSGAQTRKDEEFERDRGHQKFACSSSAASPPSSPSQ